MIRTSGWIAEQTYSRTDVPHVLTYFRELLPTAQNGTQ